MLQLMLFHQLFSILSPKIIFSHTTFILNKQKIIIIPLIFYSHKLPWKKENRNYILERMEY